MLLLSKSPASLQVLHDIEAIAAVDGPPTASRLDRVSVARQAPGAHLVLGAQDTPCRARCSLWWSDTPTYRGAPMGCIGHYAAADAAAADRILTAACERLQDRGCAYALGPMDGSSWAPHRFVTDGTADRPPFYLEPDHPAAYPDHFEDAGFTPVVRYLSSRTDAPGEAVGDVPPALPHEDLAFRTLADDQFERGLRRIYDVVTASAAHRPFYTPRSYADFAAQYQALRPAIVPELVLFAERPSDGKLVGLCFLIPDYRQRAQDTVVDTVVLQTLAVHPEAAPEGLGEWLVATAHFRAHAAGFRSVIHALLPADSSYRRLSAQYASPFRRYALFGRAL